jgi:hypothetical protein
LPTPNWSWLNERRRGAAKLERETLTETVAPGDIDQDNRITIRYHFAIASR